MWVDYENGIPDNATPSLEGSGLKITVLNENGEDITDQIGGVALTQGGGPDALQFNVPTDVVDVNDDGVEQITIRVEGLGSDYVATFKIINGKPQIDLEPEGNPTLQEDPIDPN